MTSTEEFLITLRLTPATLALWIENGWLKPLEASGARQFQPADLARARLIRTLAEDFAVNEAGIDLLLHLLDQMHDLHRALHGLATVAQNLPPETRQVLRLQLAAQFHRPEGASDG